MKNRVAVSPRVPAQRFSAQGEPDPKARPKGVDDGCAVDIRQLPGVRYQLRGDAVGQRSHRLVVVVQACRGEA